MSLCLYSIPCLVWQALNMYMYQHIYLDGHHSLCELWTFEKKYMYMKGCNLNFTFKYSTFIHVLWSLSVYILKSCLSYMQQVKGPRHFFFNCVTQASLITRYSIAISTFSSTSTLAKDTWPSLFEMMASSLGPRSLQGPHHL